MAQTRMRDNIGHEPSELRWMQLDLRRIVERLVASCERELCLSNLGPESIPPRDQVVDVVQRIQRILHPGYFSQRRIEPSHLEYYVGDEAAKLLDLLSEQISLAFLHAAQVQEKPERNTADRGQEIALRFMNALADLKSVLALDIRAAYEGDPAAKSYEEIIVCYPGFFAITVYRAAHLLFQYGVPLLPRIMTEYAHSLTGIDIHPGARIGESFFIDHGTGVVIGETTEIGHRVRVYQGVTIGALSLPKDAGDRYRNRKRHPTIEDDVIIYSGATILGGNTVIGARSVIGGNVWITESVPPDTKVLIRSPELIYIGNTPKNRAKSSEIQDGE